MIVTYELKITGSPTTSACNVHPFQSFYFIILENSMIYNAKLQGQLKYRDGKPLFHIYENQPITCN